MKKNKKRLLQKQQSDSEPTINNRLIKYIIILKLSQVMEELDIFKKQLKNQSGGTVWVRVLVIMQSYRRR